jgi:hypothetical protein
MTPNFVILLIVGEICLALSVNVLEPYSMGIGIAFGMFAAVTPFEKRSCSPAVILFCSRRGAGIRGTALRHRHDVGQST